MKNRLLFLLMALGMLCYAQPGKDGIKTVSVLNEVVNKYYPVAQSVAIGDFSVGLTTGANLQALCAGDLIMVYQAQGATMSTANNATYGSVLNYNSAGLYEFKYVQGVSGNVITTQTSFTNSYSGGGSVQVIKVPQYTTLTINAGASLGAKKWIDSLIGITNFRVGGLVVVHASTIINNGTITATDAGFRGGAYHTNSAFTLGTTDYTSTNPFDGGEKGEGIGGSQANYVNGRYCMGAPANGGGGGNAHNAGGGGGANGFNGNAWTGQGVMVVNINNPNTAWALSQAYITNSNALTNSSGGGRGGYSVGNFNANALVDPPGSLIWQVDNRREVGGFGGRPLTNIDPEKRIYLGGGGGSPEANNNASTGASDGGGIVYLIAGSGISGNGYITADGKNAGNTNPVCSCDGAPGAGAGGSIVIKTTAISLTQTLTANGGNGGNQLPINSPGDPVNESEGPGGGGGGGFVAVPAPGLVLSVNGGLNGTTLSGAVTEMNSNGATKGADGQTLTVTAAFISFLPIAGSGTTTAGSNAPVCLGNALNFTTMPGLAHTWSGPNSFSSTLQNPFIAVTTTPMAGVYTVVVSPGSCLLPLTGTVSVSFLPTPILSIANSSVCAGNTGTLTASGLSSYTWFPSNVSGSQYSDAPAATSAYTVVGTSAQGCTVAASASIIIYPAPLFSFTSAVSCAAPGSATVSASGGTGPYSYTWAPTVQTNSIATNLYPGTYTLSVLDNGTGCSFSTTKNFTASVPFTGTVMTNSISCNGNNTGTASISLSGGSGSQSYAWSDISGIQTTPTATNLSGGPHTVTVTDGASSCSFIKAFLIAQPVPFLVNIATASPTACTGSTINLTANGAGGTPAYTYTWFPGPTTNTNTATYATAGSYIYSVAATDAHNCTAAKTITLTFFTTPTVTASSATICQGSVATLTAAGANTYVWHPSGANGSTFTTSPLTTTIYTVTGISQGCPGKYTATVLVNPLPIPAIVTSNTVCSGQTLFLSGSGIGSYSWSGPAGFNSTVQNPFISTITSSNTGAYHLTLTSAEGCTASATRIITVLPSPLPVVSGATVCIGESAQLSASGGVGYVWSGPAGFASVSGTISIPVVSVTNAGNYTVTVTGTNGCASFAIAPLIGNPFPLPTPTITISPVTCVNSPINFYALGGETYSWRGPAQFVSASQNAVFTPTGLTAAGIYTLTVKNNNNCTGTATVMVNLFPQPKGSVSAALTKFCAPACAELQFNPSVNIAPVRGYTFQVNTRTLSDSSSTYCFNTAGTYTVRTVFKDTNACVNTTSLLVTAYDKPSAGFEFFPVNPLVATGQVLFTNTSVGAEQNAWNWFFSGIKGDTIRTKNTHHVFETPGDHAIAMVVKNKWGCTDTLVRTIHVGEEFSLYVPNTFTPNGDEINDIFQPKGLGIQKYRLLIFDRWGQNLFESTDFYTGWNGRFKDSDCTDDVYAWKIDVIITGGKSRSFAGQVNLVR